MNWEKYKNYYFLGIGGIGMSAIARFINLSGKEVFGYDKTQTVLTSNLENEGMEICFEDRESKIPEGLRAANTLVVITPAVSESSRQLKYFRENEFQIVKRSQLLGAITNDTINLSVAGTHGKTTTSSMLAHVLVDSGIEAVGFLGGVLESYNSNFVYSGKKYSVTEADEFDRSFLHLNPEIACITSTDADHLDIYGDKEEIVRTYKRFAAKTKKKLFVKYGSPIENATTFGFEPEADVVLGNVEIKEGKLFFELKKQGEKPIKSCSSMPGKHNILNAAAATLIALEIGLDIGVIKGSLSKFSGVKRRFSIYKTDKGTVYIDDYAHHPTELDAVISAVREFYPNKKVLGVFQPHLFSRTRDFLDDFANSLQALDELILLDIYPAREDPIEGVTSKVLLGKVNIKDKSLLNLDNVVGQILEKDFDVLLTLGAGNIDTVVETLKRQLL